MVRCPIHLPPSCWATALAVLLSTGASAQTRLNLAEALAQGLQNRYDRRADRLTEELAQNADRKSRQVWLPTLTASGNARYNTQLQTTVVPAGALPGVTEARQLAFGLRNSTIFALELTQPLYRPEARTARRLEQNTWALEREKDRQRETDVNVRIANAYLSVLLHDLQRSVARANAGRYREYLAVAEATYRLGARLERDYLNAQLDHQNSRLTLQEAEQRYRSAQATLCYELNIPTDTTLVLTDRIDPQRLTDSLPPTDTALAERSELRQLRLRREGFVLESQKIRDALRPTVSLYGNYSAQFLANDFNYVSNNWFPFNYLGVQLSLPLSGHFTQRTNRQTYQLRIRQTDLRQQQTEADVAHELRQARDDFDNAARNATGAKASLDVATQLHRSQQEQYRLGAVLYSQVLDSEKSLQTAEQRHLETVYNYLVAKLNYEKALGTY